MNVPDKDRVDMASGKDESYNTVSMQNERGEWVPALPEPFYGLRKRCDCGAKFWTKKAYQAHYALEHIVLGRLPL
jgi:hypothetical protein